MRLAMDESAENPQLKSVEIVCGHCGNRIPSTVRFGGLHQFDTSTLIGTLRNCPACRNWTVCDKENMVVIYTGGKEEVGGFTNSGTGEGKAFDNLNDDKDMSGRMLHIMGELGFQDVETFAQAIEVKPDSIHRTLDHNEMPILDTLINIAEKLGVESLQVTLYFTQGQHYPGYRVLPGE